MIFRELVLENFGPYRGRHIIDLTPQTDDTSRPIILFGGMNGGGKTTLMDAIRLALYGQRAQCSNRGNLSYSDFLSQCVNSKTPIQEKTSIELAFEHIRDDQWVDLRIIRLWTKPPKDGKDQLGVYEGEWPDTALVNTWDEYIERILPIGISNLFLFDGEQVKELAELDAPPESVINAIQTLLGLELVERLDLDLDVLVNRKRKAMATQTQLATLEAIELKLSQQRETETLVKAELVNLEKQLKKKNNNYQDALVAFQLEGGKIASERSKLETQIKNTHSSVEAKREELRQLSAKFLPLQLILPLLKQVQFQAKKEKIYSEYLVTRNVLQERENKLLDYLEKIDIERDKIEKITDFLNRENSYVNQVIEEKEEPWLKLDQEDIKQLERIIEYQLPEQTKQAEDILNELAELENIEDSYERELALAASPEAYTQLNEELKLAQQELREAQRLYDEGKRQYEEVKKLIEHSKKELGNYTEENLAQQNSEHIIKTAAKVKKTLAIFRERLTLKKLNKLEGEVTACFRYLLHKSDLVHRVAIDSKNFSIYLYDSNGKSVPKHRLSAGEKQLLAIAFLWGLARVSGRNLPIAIDTPLGRLDSSHRYNLIERYFPTASHQVILLSTDTEIGKTEVEILRNCEAIAKEYLLTYDSTKSQTEVEKGYFF